MTLFASCETENEGDDNGEKNGKEILESRINTKWEVSDSNSPFASFEFNEDGTYIVIEKEVEIRSKSIVGTPPKRFFPGSNLVKTGTRSGEFSYPQVYFGTYTIEGNKITLSGLGVIEVTDITDTKFTFSFTHESTGEKSNIVAGKTQESIPSSSRTDMLCRTWVAEKVTINYSLFTREDIEFAEEEYGPDWKTVLEEEYLGISILFSKAGTYTVFNFDGQEGVVKHAYWKWANSQETQINYSSENWEDEWEKNILTIKKLTSSNLEIEEDYGVTLFLTPKNK